MVSIFSQTATQFVQSHYDLHGKGKQHALHLYKLFMKKGLWNSEDPLFNNASELYSKITDATDRKLLTVSSVIQEGDTAKLLIETADGYLVESVSLPMKHGRTLCVSSQVGCKMGCAFCETGRMGLLRNLEASEIVQQVFLAREQHPIHNIVFMGMGEPFDNYDAVMQSIDVLTDQNGLAIGMGNITVSTSGKVREMYRFADDTTRTCNLAVSLNGAESALRSKLMPHNRKEGLQDIYDAILYYNNKKNRSVMLAYVLLAGINDSIEHAIGLINYVKGLDIKINLIPYNPQRNDRFKRPDDSVIEQFSEYLHSQGLQVLYRKTKGTSIMAACGQLGGKKTGCDPL